MRDTDCISFLQWALPHMELRWPGFRKVRGQVCKRIARRLAALELETVDDYRRYLAEHEREWSVLDGLCRITISRFCRDRAVFATLFSEVIPRLSEAASPGPLEAWSAGCGAGEEPYTLALLAREAPSSIDHRTGLRILATDTDAHQLERARTGVYPASALRELPDATIEHAFEPIETTGHHIRHRIRDRYKSGISFRLQDLRRQMPPGPFHLILCRNLAFTYFDRELQRRVATALFDRLAPGGVLVVGSHEALPDRSLALAPLSACAAILQRASD